ncbi:MAG: methylated-DNA--[protein]-cysteine S-methyltransferase, partial [Methylobacter sp.]|nr:methylated-DNA--[protein]-cysteine S-methyltransferase [Methylobacter sp.]
MPFIIEWVENCSGAEEVISLQTPGGQFVLTCQQGVISKTDWEPGVSSNPPVEHELNSYWQNPDKPINIKLLKQGSTYRNKVWAALCQIPFGET